LLPEAAPLRGAAPAVGGYLGALNSCTTRPEKNNVTKQTRRSADAAGGLLKSLLVLSRAVDEVLEKRAVEAATGGPLATSKVKVLRLLGEGGSQTSTRVARFLGVTKPAVSQIIDSMAQSRLVVRRRAKEDRREINLELTKLGRTKYQAIRRGQHNLLRSVLRSVKRGPKDWTGGLQGMAVALTHANDACGDFCLQCVAHPDGSCVLDCGDTECPFLQGISAEAACPTRGPARKQATKKLRKRSR
jgi:DNA-binding MarR family transcriptional regulator